MAGPLAGLMAVPVGLEPTTHWLTVNCSSNWATKPWNRIWIISPGSGRPLLVWHRRKLYKTFSLVVCLQPDSCLSRKITCNLLVSKGNRTLQISNVLLMSPRLRHGGRRRTRTATLHPKWSMLPLHYVLHMYIAFYLSYFYGSLPLFMSELFCAPQLLLYSKLLEPGSSGRYFLCIVCSYISFTLAI